MAATSESSGPLVGVLALQGAFEEHQACLEAIGCRTVQVSCGFLSQLNVCFFRPLDSDFSWCFIGSNCQ